MPTLRSYISHSLTSTDNTKILGADQAQYLVPKLNPQLTNASLTGTTSLDMDIVLNSRQTFIKPNSAIVNEEIYIMTNKNSALNIIEDMDGSSFVTLLAGNIPGIAIGGKYNTGGTITIGTRGHKIDTQVKGDTVKLSVDGHDVTLNVDKTTSGLRKVVHTVTSAGNSTITELMDVVLVNADTPIYLPTASGITGKEITIKYLVTAADGIIPLNETELIDGSTSTLYIDGASSNQYSAVTLISNGVSWYIINKFTDYIIP